MKKVAVLVLEDVRIKMKLLAEKISLSVSIINTILHEHFSRSKESEDAESAHRQFSEVCIEKFTEKFRRYSFKR